MLDIHIKGMAKTLGQTIPELSGQGIEQEIQAVLKTYWSGKKAVIWSREDIKSFAEQMHIPIDNHLADQVLTFVTEGAHDADIGVNWDSVESAIQTIYPKTFDGFKMVQESDPTDDFDVEETLREWQEWGENEAPGM